MGMRFILFLTVWEIGHVVNCPFCKLQGLRERKMYKFIANEKYRYQNTKLISKDFATNTRAEILVSKVWPWNKLKGFMLSVIRLEDEVNFFIEKFLQVFCFRCIAVVKTENLEARFLRGFFSNSVLPVIGNCDLVSFQISCRKWEETWLKKSSEISNYGKFIYHGGIQ